MITIKTKEEFIQFVNSLKSELDKNAEGWENAGDPVGEVDGAIEGERDGAVDGCEVVGCIEGEIVGDSVGGIVGVHVMAQQTPAQTAR